MTSESDLWRSSILTSFHAGFLRQKAWAFKSRIKMWLNLVPPILDFSLVLDSTKTWDNPLPVKLVFVCYRCCTYRYYTNIDQWPQINFDRIRSIWHVQRANLSSILSNVDNCQWLHRQWWTISDVSTTSLCSLPFNEMTSSVHWY